MPNYLKHAKKAKKKLKHLLWAIPLAKFVLIVVVFIAAASTAGVVGKALYDLASVAKGALDFLDDVFSGEDGEELKAVIEDAVGEDIRYSLDCSNWPADEAEPGVNCLEGLIDYGEGESWSPIPKDKLWMVPVWQKAAKKYNMPWQLLAAVNGAKTQFGKVNCDTSYGDGWYRLDYTYWSNYAIDAGEPEELESTSSTCSEARGPAEVYPEDEWDRTPVRSATGTYWPGDTHDPVDSTFALARALAERDVKGEKNWDSYNGSPSNNCIAPDNDGRIYLPPTPPNSGGGVGGLGYNKNLEIPQALLKEAAKWRSNQGELKPRRADDPSAGSRAMPKKLLLQMLVASWIAFGKNKSQAQQNANANLQQIMLESGGRPYILQGHIGDVNDNNPAGGLFQFIPETFDAWAVDGFEDRFNPMHNIMAAVNAQVNSGMSYILNGSSGWGPGSGSNPYTSGGKKIKVTDDTKLKDIKAKPYNGKTPTDTISEAIQYNGSDRLSSCTTAIIHDWYDLIKKYPPPNDSGGSFAGLKWLKNGKLVPCPKAIPQDTGNPCYVDSRIVDNLLYLHKKYQIYISDGYSGPLPNGGAAGCYADGGQCHTINGEHPLGVAVDLIPASGGVCGSAGWDKISKLAKWAEPSADNPRAPFSWVGYDGDTAHGCGHHLHLSWNHSPAKPYTIPKKVQVFGTAKGGGGGSTVSGPVRKRIVKLAQKELKKGVRESGANNPVEKGGKKAVYNINGLPWCAAFASRMWLEAGVKEIAKVEGIPQQDGKALPASVATLDAWGKQKGLFHSSNPKPGDMIIYGSSHVGLVETVKNGKVITTIEGNYSDAVTRRSDGFPGVTGYVSPPGGGKGGKGKKK